jgi:ribosomal protein L6P/L9E
MQVHPTIKVKKEDGKLIVERPDDERQSRALHGLTRALLNNMVTGVSTGLSPHLAAGRYRLSRRDEGQESGRLRRLFTSD